MSIYTVIIIFFFSSRRRHMRLQGDWSSDVCSSDLGAVHGAFYPIYLTERVGLDEKWIGQVSNLAVVIEIFFVFGCGALVARLGMKRLLLVRSEERRVGEGRGPRREVVLYKRARAAA